MVCLWWWGPRRLTTAYGLTDLARDLFIKTRPASTNVHIPLKSTAYCCSTFLHRIKKIKSGAITLPGHIRGHSSTLSWKHPTPVLWENNLIRCCLSHGLFSGKPSQEAPKLQQDCAEKMVIAIARINNPAQAAELEENLLKPIPVSSPLTTKLS